MSKKNYVLSLTETYDAGSQVQYMESYELYLNSIYPHVPLPVPNPGFAANVRGGSALFCRCKHRHTISENNI